MGFVPFTFVDLIDIILVAVIMYWIYRMTKGTNAPYILSGIIAVYLLWVVVRALNMELLSTILGQLISVGAIALIIVFQPELRRFLQMIGMRQKHFNFITRIFSTGEDTVQTNVVPIVTACREMSETKTGALIVIGQQSDLRLIAEGGIALDAKVSTSLIKNIFFKNAPLHDGAALIEGDRIVAATYLCAACAAGGDIFLRRAREEQLATVTLHLRTLGIHRTMPESLVKALEGLRPAWGIQ